MAQHLDLPPARNLPDACVEGMALAMGLRGAAEPASADGLRQTAHSVFERLGERARQAGVDSANIDRARYALCALIDETVLNSNWETVKTDWIGRPLQMEYFQSFTAGEQFYAKLDQLRGSSDPADVDVLEVYTQCLALGFRGKYADLAGLQQIAALVDGLCREIRAARGHADSRLSGRWQREDKLPDRIKRTPAWAVAVGGAALLLLLLWVLDSMLAGQAAEVIAESARRRT